MSGPLGVIIMKKEPGETSFESLRPVKRALRGQKVGHAGTLDKFASGLMVVLTGEATRLNPLFSGFDKSYVARVRFGSETDTLDPEGEVVATSGHIPTKAEIEEALKRFIGEQDQTPPAYSAVHVRGKRAYQEARKGREVEMPSRRITIYSADLVSWDEPDLVVALHVSKGTYIRSFARDLALSLGSRAHLVNLERTKIGPFGFGHITHIPATNEETRRNLSLVCGGDVEYDPAWLARLANGLFNERAVLDVTGAGDGYYTLSCGEKLAGIVERRGGAWKITAVDRREDL